MHTFGIHRVLIRNFLHCLQSAQSICETFNATRIRSIVISLRSVYFQKHNPIELLHNLFDQGFIDKKLLMSGHIANLTCHVEGRLHFGNPHKHCTAMKAVAIKIITIFPWVSFVRIKSEICMKRTATRDLRRHE